MDAAQYLRKSRMEEGMDTEEVLRLLEDVEDGRYDAVLVMDLDRLSRGRMKDQGIILDAFRDSGTLIVTPEKTYDLSESYNKRLPQIAVVLGTTVEYLVTGENKTPAGQDADGREKEFIQLFGKLTPEQQDLVIAQLRGVVNSQDK